MFKRPSYFHVLYDFPYALSADWCRITNSAGAFFLCLSIQKRHADDRQENEREYKRFTYRDEYVSGLDVGISLAS